jgi:hypothetical protein
MADRVELLRQLFEAVGVRDYGIADTLLDGLLKLGAVLGGELLQDRVHADPGRLQYEPFVPHVRTLDLLMVKGKRSYN